MLASNPSAKPVAKIAGSNALLPAFVLMILARMRENAGVWGRAPVATPCTYRRWHLPVLFVLSALDCGLQSEESSIRL